MGRTFLLLALALMGCAKGYDGVSDEIYALIQEGYWQVKSHADDWREHYRLLNETASYQKAVALRDSLLEQSPSIRRSDDSLARQDSITYAYLLSLRISSEYYLDDTTKAVFRYIEAAPWFEVLDRDVQAEEARLFAETTGDAIGVTHSPNMARISYQAFERARRLGLASEDPTLYHLADSSYNAVARQVLTMSDSVRAAFGPPPDRPARIPWVLATLAAAFIAASVAGGWGWNGNTQAPRFARPLSQKKRR